MRFFTTCLLLFCFQSFVVCTIEDGSVTFAQDFIVKAKYSKDTKVVAKQAANQQIVFATFHLSDISHQQLNKHLSLFVKSLNSDKIIYFHCVNKITSLFKNYNHTYNFIFKCLYPKHNFW